MARLLEDLPQFKTALHVKENATPGSSAVGGFATPMPEDTISMLGVPSKTEPGEYDWECVIRVTDINGKTATLPDGESTMVVQFTSIEHTDVAEDVMAAADTYMRTTLKMLDGDPVIAAVID